MRKKLVIGKTERKSKRGTYLWMGKGSTPSGWIRKDIGLEWMKKTKKK